MSDDKKNEDTTPTVVFTETQPAAPPRKTKKYVIVAGTVILAAAIILTAILVGIYIFTQAQKEIIQYTMQVGNNNKQDVTSDPNENVVQYHMSTPSQDAWIINDFNKDIQLMKVVSEGKTNCFVTALNRTDAVDPTQITGPDTKELTEAVSVMYQFSDTPIADTSFLGKTARAACKGVSIYWLYPYCSNGNVNQATNGTDMDHPKKKRQTTNDQSPNYCQNYMSYKSPSDKKLYNVPCYTGCCRKVCACSVTFTWQVSNGQYRCNWVTKNCPPAITANPVYYDALCDGPKGITCIDPKTNKTPNACGCP
jgi:hypothetical protein